METETDPVVIMPKKNFTTLMVQTDPMIEENLHMLEPYSLPLPLDPKPDLKFEITPIQ